MAHYLVDLAERRPDLWKNNPEELAHLLSGKRFNEWVEEITKREIAFVEVEKRNTVLDGRVYGKLIP